MFRVETSTALNLSLALLKDRNVFSFQKKIWELHLEGVLRVFFVSFVFVLFSG